MPTIFSLPCQAKYREGSLKDIRGLCISEDPETNALFFLPEQNYQTDYRFYPIYSYYDIFLPGEKTTLFLVDQNVNGRWVRHSDLIFQDIDSTLFPFFSLTYSLNQLLKKLEDETK